MYGDVPYVENFGYCPICGHDSFDEVKDTGSHLILIRVRKRFGDLVRTADFITAPDHSYHINILVTKDGKSVHEAKHTVNKDHGNILYHACINKGYYIDSVYIDKEKSDVYIERPFGKEER